MRFHRIIAALPALVLLGIAAHAADAWTTFNDPDRAFSVQVPSAPTVAHDSITNTDGQKVPMLEYTIDRGTSAMIVIISDLTAYPDADHDKVMQGAINGAKSSATQTLSDQATELDSQQGRAVEIVDKDGNHITDWIFFVRGRLYQVMHVLPSTPAPAETAMVKRFQDSFHFAR
ncbi:MAG TPA: hypothetical protein VN932_07540 [Rhizomicrobium sp.]|nr:hypothetical protein [Rhizomicrobium sp.]